MGNKKIKGAKVITYNGVTFRSSLECTCYKLLTDAGIKFDYEGRKFTLRSGYRLKNVTYIHAGPGKKNTWFKEELTKKGDKLKVIAWTYTPDFIIDTPKYCITIETKGFANDTWSLKKKMFLHYLEHIASTQDRKFYFFEPRLVRHVEEMIEMIKTIIDENK